MRTQHLRYAPWLAIATALSLGACKNKQQPSANDESAPPSAAISRDIRFRVDVTQEEAQYYEDGFSPYVNLATPAPVLDRLHDKDVIVIKRPTVDVLIDYPLTRPVTVTLKASSTAGFNRADLIRQISAEYHRIYEEEERTASVKTLPPEQRGRLMNRNTTDGKYGICCHDLEDLDMHTITINEQDDGDIILELGIDS